MRINLFDPYPRVFQVAPIVANSFRLRANAIPTMSHEVLKQLLLQSYEIKLHSVKREPWHPKKPHERAADQHMFSRKHKTENVSAK